MITEHSIVSARCCRVAAVLLAGAVTNLIAGAPETTRNAEGIMDNSFLVEEAYNQEAGVVQHILTAAYGYQRAGGADFESWSFGFTQEWPLFSQKHQVSYSIPYLYTHGGGMSADGLGDVLLNYRYQAYLNEETLCAFAPRFSLVLPTGDADRDLGEDTLGCQVNLPFSTALNDKWFVHANAGATFLPAAASANDRDLRYYNLGASAIYAATRDVHLMLEWIGIWVETPRTSGSLRHEFASVISPGARKAFNFRNGAQLVVGAAVPVGITSSAPDYGVFLYASFEHWFRRQP